MRSKPLDEVRCEPLLVAEFPCEFGIEEEFFLTDPGSRDVVPTMPAGFLRRCQIRFGSLVSSELLQGQVEVATPVCRSALEAREALEELRAGVNDEARACGLALLAAGTHPLADWRAQHCCDKPRYHQLMDDFRAVAQRNLVCGLHVHVAIPCDVDRIRIMNHVMPWVPLLLALSTSSPFWNGASTGLMSYRQAAYDEWPRSGIPDYFADETEFGAYVQRLVAAGSMADAKSIWWAVRPSPSYPTLEFRIADACTDVEDAICIAQICRCLVRAALLAAELPQPWDAAHRLVIDENRWRAKRYGLDATFLVDGDTAPRSASAVLDDLIAQLHPHAQWLGCTDEVLHAREIVRRGTSAHRQRRVHDGELARGATPPEAVRAVVDDLLARTAASTSAWPKAA